MIKMMMIKFILMMMMMTTCCPEGLHFTEMMRGKVSFFWIDVYLFDECGFPLIPFLLQLVSESAIYLCLVSYKVRGDSDDLKGNPTVY